MGRMEGRVEWSETSALAGHSDGSIFLVRRRVACSACLQRPPQAVGGGNRWDGSGDSQFTMKRVGAPLDRIPLALASALLFGVGQVLGHGPYSVVGGQICVGQNKELLLHVVIKSNRYYKTSSVYDG